MLCWSAKKNPIILLMPLAFARRLRLASETKRCSSNWPIPSKANLEDGNEM